MPTCIIRYKIAGGIPRDSDKRRAVAEHFEATARQLISSKDRIAKTGNFSGAVFRGDYGDNPMQVALEMPGNRESAAQGVKDHFSTAGFAALGEPLLIQFPCINKFDPSDTLQIDLGQAL